MNLAPFATARLEGNEVILTIGDEQIRFDNALNGYQAAHAVAEQVNAIQAREEAKPGTEWMADGSEGQPEPEPPHPPPSPPAPHAPAEVPDGYEGATSSPPTKRTGKKPTA